MGPNQSRCSTRQHVLCGWIDRRLQSERREWGAKRSTGKHAPSSRPVASTLAEGIGSPSGSNSGDACGRRPQLDTVRECSIKNNEIVKTTPLRNQENWRPAGVAQRDRTGRTALRVGGAAGCRAILSVPPNPDHVVAGRATRHLRERLAGTAADLPNG